MLARLALAAAVATLLAGSAGAQGAPGEKFSGAIKVAAADHVTIATAAKGDLDFAVTPQTRVVYRGAASAAEIKPGAYLGTSNLNTPEGGKATEVHLGDNGPNVHFSMDDKAGLMMTNGHVKSVTATAKGEEFDVDYGAAATRHVVLPPNTPVTRTLTGNMAMLKPGVPVTVYAAPGADGKLAVRYISIQTPPKP